MTRRTAQTLILMLALLVAIAIPASAESTPTYGAAIRLSPSSGPAGSSLTVRGRNFYPPLCKLDEGCSYYVALQFTDAVGVVTLWPSPEVDWAVGRFSAMDTIPVGAAVGTGVVQAKEMECRFFPFSCFPIAGASYAFTVTVQHQARTTDRSPRTYRGGMR
jgi:hypothetical protein